MKKILQALKYVLFLAVGILIFWWLYRDMDKEELLAELANVNYWWIVLSFILGMLSHISRAVRWKMLIKPLGYNPRVINCFLAVMVMYLVNMLLPRAGELARCTVLTKYEKAPFSGLVGTVAVERLVDFLILIVLAVAIIFLQLDAFQMFLDKNPAVATNLQKFMSPKYIAMLVAVFGVIVAGFIFLKQAKLSGKIGEKINSVKQSFIEGIGTIMKLEQKGWFVFHTLFIYLMWLVMLYVVFFAYPPTKNLTIPIAMLTFVMSGLAMVAPVQAGMGAWHFMVYQTLVVYGITEAHGKTFALIAHSATYIGLMIMGVISLIIMPMINSGYQPTKYQAKNNISQKNGK